MFRNILELKSIHIAPEKVRTCASAKKVAKLRDFELKAEYFETVYHPADLVKNIAYYEAGKTYNDNVCVADIKGTTHPSYYGMNWLSMMMSLERHKEDHDVEAVRAAIFNTNCFEPIQLSKYDDIYFIDGGGNHRVCQAKFLGLETVPCEVTAWRMTIIPDLYVEETVFTPKNLGPDCDLIAHYMGCFYEDYMRPALEIGDFTEAISLYVRLLFGLTDHFVADEHWRYYDDSYSPDYALRDIWDKFIPYIRSGAISDAEITSLEERLAWIEKTEAFHNYGIPSLIPFRDLKNAKAFLER